MQYSAFLNRNGTRRSLSLLFLISCALSFANLAGAQTKPSADDTYHAGHSTDDAQKAEAKAAGVTRASKSSADASLTPPVNDSFANATPITGQGGMPGNNVGATGEPGEPIHGAGNGSEGPGQNNSIWYKYTAPQTGVTTIRTIPQQQEPMPIGDTVLSVYTGSSVTALTRVVENDDYYSSFYSQVTFSVNAGETYYVAVDGYHAMVGDFWLGFLTEDRAANDNMAAAEDLGPSGVSPFIGVTGSNRGATGQANEPIHYSNASMPTNSVWYKWTAPASSTYTFTTAGSNFDTILAVYRSNLNLLTSAGANDDFGNSAAVRTSKVTFYAEANETFLIAVDGFSTATGNILLNWYRDAEEAGKRFDLDGDRLSDIGIVRPSNGQWWVKYANNATFATTFGTSSDKPVPADYTGDGKVDIAFWQPSTGFWYVLRSEDNSFFAAPYGTAGDIPVPAKYDNDSRADFAVFRPSAGTWYIQQSRNGSTTVKTFGTNGDQPVVADYDADGYTDIAIFRPSNGQWWIDRSTEGITATVFGAAGDIPLPGPYTTRGKSTIAFWRPSTGEWFILNSVTGGGYFGFPFGESTDIPAPADYNGDGKFDITVFRPSSGLWYISSSSGGQLSVIPFGSPGDKPLAASFHP